MNNIIIIIPAYNEEGNISELLFDIKKLSEKFQIKVVVVDDGSTDKTLEIVKSFQDKLDLSIVIHNPNKGVPQTFYDGFKKAAEISSAEDIMILIEGDGTSDLKLIPLMIEKINSGNQIVVASRSVKGGKYKNFPWQRTMGSMAVNFVLKIFFYVKGITDYTIFYRAYKADIIKKAIEKYQDKFITSKSFAANLEVLIKAKEYITSASEVPLIYDYGLKKGKSKMNLFKTLWEYKDLIVKKLLKKSLF